MTAYVCRDKYKLVICLLLLELYLKQEIFPSNSIPHSIEYKQFSFLPDVSCFGCTVAFVFSILHTCIYLKEIVATKITLQLRLYNIRIIKNAFNQVKMLNSSWVWKHNPQY